MCSIELSPTSQKKNSSKKAKEINKKHTITYDDGYIPYDVLVARVINDGSFYI